LPDLPPLLATTPYDPLDESLAPVLTAIALGSNLDSARGDRSAHLRLAIEQLATIGNVRAVSSCYDTEPVGYTDQPRFLNAAIIFETTLPPAELMRVLLGIEHAMGRNRAAVVPKGPRVLDLDLLLYGDRILQTPLVTVPHPAMAERRFVLQPLSEIAPTWLHPVLGCTIAEMLARLPPE
jgi:2-amino-4-hydroxy-6-hydroxymethyldihydropteridine diphosphokinase